MYEHRERPDRSGPGPRPAQVAALLGPLLDGVGVDLEHLELASAGRRKVLRVVVDRDGGVDLDAVAQISRAVSTALDSGELMGSLPYVLEVTSPGVDRPLTRPIHWRRASGRLVRVDLASGGRVDGRLSSSDELGAVLEISDTRQQVRLSYTEVAQARVQVEFAGGASAISPGRDLSEGTSGTVEGEEGR